MNSHKTLPPSAAKALNELGDSTAFPLSSLLSSSSGCSSSGWCANVFVARSLYLCFKYTFTVRNCVHPRHTNSNRKRKYLTIKHRLAHRVECHVARRVVFSWEGEVTSERLAFRHLPRNTARFSCATEGALFISAQLSTDAVSALRKVWVQIWLWKQPSALESRFGLAVRLVLKRKDLGSIPLRLSFHIKSCGLWTRSCDFVPLN